MADSGTQKDHSRWTTLGPRERLGALVALLLISGVFGVAGWTEPDPRGLGTHEQLFLGQCRMIQFFGIPCPFCGMTTAFAHMARGEIGQGIQAQPVGAAIFVIAAAAGILLALAAMAGRIPRIRLLKPEWGSPIFYSVVAVLFLGWVYKLITFL